MVAVGVSVYRDGSPEPERRPVGVPLADTVPKRADSSYGWSMPRDYARSPLKIKGRSSSVIE